MSGLGLSDFLNHNKDSGQKWLRNWKDPKTKKGEIVVWIHTRASIAYPTWNHPFLANGTFVDKETNEERPTLRYPKFVSPDPEIVHQQQYFRNRATDSGPEGHLRTPPALDPFLRLREWLRLVCDLPLDTVVFEWNNPNPRRNEDPIRRWTRGQLAKLVDKTNSTYSHSLDSKLEYLFVVVADDDAAGGAQIVRAPKLLGEQMKEAIGQSMESDGEEGNPLLNPYAFKWTFDGNQPSPMNYYKAFRYNAAKLTQPIRDAITSTDHPDPTSQTIPRAGDKAKIRAAMEDAAQIKLPWDHLFVDAWVDKDPTDFPHGANASSSEPNGKGSTPAASTTTSTPGSGPKTRRRKKKAAPAPEPDRIKCDDCPAMLLPTDAKCPQCGAEYEIDAAAPPTVSSPTETSTSSTGSDKCWSCGGRVEGDKCVDCGLDVTDDLPFG